MHGVWTALITPFNESSQLDLSAFKRILQEQVRAGVSGVIPCGTTGEAPTLSREEKKILIQTSLQELKGTSVQVVAGVGTSNTQETLELATWAAQAGVAGLLVVTPYYNKPSQAGLESHFLSIAEAVSCEVILYNVPGRTGVSLTAETVVRLAKHPRIRTLKEGQIPLASEIFDLAARNGLSIDLLSGDDSNYLPLLSIGGAGVISVASNLFPRAMVAIQNAVDQGHLAEARAIHQRFYPLFRDLFIESNPVPVKQAMADLGWCLPKVRMPLAPLALASVEKLRQSLRYCGVTQGALL